MASEEAAGEFPGIRVDPDVGHRRRGDSAGRVQSGAGVHRLEVPPGPALVVGGGHGKAGTIVPVANFVPGSLVPDHQQLAGAAQPVQVAGDVAGGEGGGTRLMPIFAAVFGVGLEKASHLGPQEHEDRPVLEFGHHRLGGSAESPQAPLPGKGPDHDGPRGPLPGRSAVVGEIREAAAHLRPVGVSFQADAIPVQHPRGHGPAGFGMEAVELPVDGQQQTSGGELGQPAEGDLQERTRRPRPGSGQVDVRPRRPVPASVPGGGEAEDPMVGMTRRRAAEFLGVDHAHGSPLERNQVVPRDVHGFSLLQQREGFSPGLSPVAGERRRIVVHQGHDVAAVQRGQDASGAGGQQAVVSVSAGRNGAGRLQSRGSRH